MAFRKRNVGITRNLAPGSASEESNLAATSAASSTPPPGVRPSPLDGRSTTSTGTPSLDGILAGHAGLALGSSLLVEESGTTDYAGALLRYYAAEGIVQGHHLHIVGVGEQWVRELPALVSAAGEGAEGHRSRDKEKMKIAWRYERLGDFGEGKPSSRGAAPAVERSPTTLDSALNPDDAVTAAYCHTFDLAKRLMIPSGASITYSALSSSPSSSPFLPIIQSLQQLLLTTPSTSIHRLVVPLLLSPALYPPHACLPQHFLQFLHGLRALLRQYPTRLTMMLTLPLFLHPRTSGLTRWIELLCDGVIELSPFPHTSSELDTSGAATKGEDKPQGMLKVHRLPVFHERGGGGGGVEWASDLAFTVSRRKFVIKPFSLPPMEGDGEAQKGLGEGKSGSGGVPSAKDIEF